MSYTNKDGQKVYTTDVVVEEHEFVESKGNSRSNNNSSQNDATRQQDNKGSYTDSGELPFG